MSPHLSEGDILILVQVLLASALVPVLASASNFLVCTISYESVVGFLPNFHGYIIGT